MGRAQRLKHMQRMVGWGMVLSKKGWEQAELLPVDYKVAEGLFSVETVHGLVHGNEGDIIIRYVNGDIGIINKATWPLVARALAPAEPGLTVQAHRIEGITK